MIKVEFNNLYGKGDTVIFKRGKRLLVGIITGYSVDTSAGNSIWYDIAIGGGYEFTFTTAGDILEQDIICKLSDKNAIDKVTSIIREKSECK